MRRLILSITCPDRVGIVAAVTTFIARQGGSVVEAAQHADLDTGHFFQRIEIDAESLSFTAQDFAVGFEQVATECELQWHLSDTDVPKRVVVLASREEHCLSDILHRWRIGELPCEVVAVISNHQELRRLTEWHEVDFHYIPVTASSKKDAMAQIVSCFDEVKGDVMVLARYMQILPEDVCNRYPGRIINIHHSFLPSFAGARPYHQAFERGVKLIGATCHYVTAELDAGAIIEQDTSRINHGDTVDDLIRIGRDVERNVLARGLRWHLEDRVLLDDNRTVVFP